MFQRLLASERRPLIAHTMQPIRFSCAAELPATPAEVSGQILDVSRWAEFEGYGVLPGIARAEFESRPEGVVGARIRVTNRDGSTHVEEITQWSPTRFELHLKEFSAPVSRLATHFVEFWELRPAGRTTHVTRTMELHPKSWATRPLLWLISFLLRGAIARPLTQLRRASSRPLAPDAPADGSRTAPADHSPGDLPAVACDRDGDASQ